MITKNVLKFPHGMYRKLISPVTTCICIKAGPRCDCCLYLYVFNNRLTK